jgi:heat shock protein HtpX
MRIIRTAFVLGVLTLFLMMVGQYFGGRNGMTLGLGIAICTNAFAYFFSDKIALLSSGARPVSREELPRLYAVMERLAAKANLPVPKLYVIPEAAPNAFATGRNPRHASVAVTEGLLQLMNDDELEGVIAHELSHVRNYDILISSIAATLAGAITWIAHWGPWLGGGDRDGARMVGQPYGLMSALQKLGAYNQRIPTTTLSPSTSALCIVKPFFGGGALSSLFSTHPPLEKRIEALRELTVTPQR